MATISGSTSEKVFSLTAFKGLNQNPDGDTKLKLGEAAEMYNWRVTRDGNLQRRPGTKTTVDTETGKPIKGLWVGFVNCGEYMLGAVDGKLYKFWDETNGFVKAEIGAVDTSGDVQIFGFNNICYILDGVKYRQWDSTTYKEVEGYVPLVMIAIPPSGSADNSTTLENVNRLTGKRRVWISPNGTGDTFQLPENPIVSVDYVKHLGTNEEVPSTDYSVDTEAGTVTFGTAPAQSANSYEIGYTVTNYLRGQVENMRYFELYAGQQDTRVFLYGDNTNKCIYSGLDYDGEPAADYFPDLYECAVGDENTPITGMIRHYSALVCYKSNSSWMITATELTLADTLNIPAFYVTPVNKAIGNAAMGQVRLVLNSPYTLFGNDLYEWRNSSYYTSNLTRDERQARRISDRVWDELKRFETQDCYCYDDNDAQEYYICYNGTALVYNYAADAWSRYTDFPVSCMASLRGELFIGSPDGKVKHVSYDYASDDNNAIKSYWESGSMSFGADYMRKYSAQLWVGIKPESRGEVTVTVRTDRNDAGTEKLVASELFGFDNVDFAAWDFNISTRPKMKRLKIKAKKFVFYKLVFRHNSSVSGATVLAADIRVRFTGYSK